jgi:hypothetical protein
MIMLARESIENEPRIMAPRVTPLEGVSTYALRGIRMRGVENPQGFGIDERRFNTSYQENILVASEKDCEKHLNTTESAEDADKCIKYAESILAEVRNYLTK